MIGLLVLGVALPLALRANPGHVGEVFVVWLSYVGCCLRCRNANALEGHRRCLRAQMKAETPVPGLRRKEMASGELGEVSPTLSRRT